jgi:hypothetical protein
MSDEDRPQGGGIINVAWAGTAAFAATALVATIWPDALGDLAATVAVVLFAIGCGVFLWSYALAVARSRHDLIGIGGLYFLAGSAPKVVAFRLRLALAVEVVVAIATASIRPFTSLAFGILVPMFGLALCGLWGARFGSFPSRAASEQT